MKTVQVITHLMEAGHEDLAEKLISTVTYPKVAPLLVAAYDLPKDLFETKEEKEHQQLMKKIDSIKYKFAEIERAVRKDAFDPQVAKLWHKIDRAIDSLRNARYLKSPQEIKKSLDDLLDYLAEQQDLSSKNPAIKKLLISLREFIRDILIYL